MLMYYYSRCYHPWKNSSLLLLSQHKHSHIIIYLSFSKYTLLKAKKCTLFSFYIILNWKTLNADSVLLRRFVDKSGRQNGGRFETDDINSSSGFWTTFWDHISVVMDHIYVAI